MSIPPRIEQIKSMLKMEPEDAFLNYALATEYVAIGRHQEARSIFESLIDKKPDYVATYYHLGKLYETLHLRDNALKIYESGIETAQRIGDLHAKSELHEALNDLLFEDD